MAITIKHKYQELQKNCTISFIHAQISDVAQLAQDVHDNITNTSWINSLEAVDKLSYEKRANKTIKYIVDKILANVTTKVTEDLGELVISTKAQDLLKSEHNHKHIPLAELWKEKVRGNPGFDFHTETPTNFIAFGEAKYNSNQASYTAAINQVVKFIGDEKDIAELSDLHKFVGEITKSNCVLPLAKAFTMAFSVHNDNSVQTFENVKKSANFERLLIYPELYLIGIEFVS